MPHTTANGLRIGFELIGDGEGSWVLTPGGRFAKETPGLADLAAELASAGNRVLIWDRPNCGESDVCFEGPSESEMQAETLAALLQRLDMTPAIVAGGSGGSRVSLLTAANHPDVARGLVVWWISGGVMGLMALAHAYCTPSIGAAWTDGMEAVAAMPDWAEVVARNPANRQKILEQDRDAFVATLEHWCRAYCPRPDFTAGLPDELIRRITVPALVFRSGRRDAYHTRATSERLAELIPDAQLVEPPWGDREWADRQDSRAQGLFVRWPLLAPTLLEWVATVPR